MLTRLIDPSKKLRQLALKAATPAWRCQGNDIESSTAVIQRSLAALYRQQYLAGLPPVRFLDSGSDYASASLQAFVMLGRGKGDRLIGVNGISTNAFFIRDDIVLQLAAGSVAGGLFRSPPGAVRHESSSAARAK